MMYLKRREKNLIFELSERRVNTEANQEDISTKFWNDNVSDINRLKEYARSGRHIRIWYSNAPFSMCGFYFVNSLLKNFSCNISAIKLPEYLVREDEAIITYKSWGEVIPDKLYDFFEI